MNEQKEEVQEVAKFEKKKVKVITKFSIRGKGSDVAPNGNLLSGNLKKHKME